MPTDITQERAIATNMVAVHGAVDSPSNSKVHAPIAIISGIAVRLLCSTGPQTVANFTELVRCFAYAISSDTKTR